MGVRTKSVGILKTFDIKLRKRGWPKTENRKTKTTFLFISKDFGNPMLYVIEGGSKILKIDFLSSEKSNGRPISC